MVWVDHNVETQTTKQQPAIPEIMFSHDPDQRSV